MITHLHDNAISLLKENKTHHRALPKVILADIISHD